MKRVRIYFILFIYLFSSSTSNGIEVQTKNIGYWPKGQLTNHLCAAKINK